jgi:RNA polymerase sigma-70 factor, ECF subfamily
MKTNNFKSKKEQFITAYTELTDPIFKYCLFRVYNRDDAKDLTQETFIKTWKYLSDGKEIKNIKAFIYKTAYHLVIDRYRKKKEFSLDLLLEKGFQFTDSSKDIKKLDNSLTALQEINKLDELYREILLLRYVEDFPVKQIGQILGLSENIVSVRIHRGLKQLQTNI